MRKRAISPSRSRRSRRYCRHIRTTPKIICPAGAAYLATGKKDLGLADYDRAVALQPKHSYLLRANAYFHLGKYDLALADCDAELKLDPADDVAKKLRDQVQAHLGGL
jgi:tetratricopeptide (TPR) repeat protein